jgi:hypothetical protein
MVRLSRFAAISQLKASARVRLLAGPFSGRFAVFAEMSGLERCAVLLRLLGAERRVAVLKNQIEVVDSGQVSGADCYMPVDK